MECMKNSVKPVEVVVEVWMNLLFKNLIEASNLVSFICLALVPIFSVFVAKISRASIAEQVYRRFNDPFSLYGSYSGSFYFCILYFPSFVPIYICVK